MQSANQHIVYLSDICGAPNHRGEDTSGQLRTSSYCIFVKLPKRPECVLLVHGYTGAYDEVSADVAAFLYRRRTLSSPLYGSWSTELDIAPDDSVLPEETLAELERRGYLTRFSRQQETDYFKSIANIVHSLERKRPCYILVPSYDCNLRCPYCFQDYMRTDPAFRRLLQPMTPELADRILAGILELEGTDSAGTHREFTFFGGEPLAAANKPLIEYIVRRASEMGPAAFGAVTNGTDLDAYVDLLGPSRISSLQVT